MLCSNTIVVIGECMLEVVEGKANGQIGYAGDTLNTAVYLARLGVPTAYMTALGDDPYSLDMLAAWREEGLDCSLVLVANGKQPGLYVVRNDCYGERSFHYWRQQAAVRSLFRLPKIDDIIDSAARANAIYLSGITLSLFDLDSRDRLHKLAEKIRSNDGLVAFDPNYRPQLWSDAREAIRAFDRFAEVTSLVLTGLEDERALRGLEDGEAILKMWCDRAVDEVIVKMGAQGCMLSDGSMVNPAARLSPRDTTAAGDAFNAGYLAARQKACGSFEAAKLGNDLASRTIMHQGAILPKIAMADLISHFGSFESNING